MSLQSVLAELADANDFSGVVAVSVGGDRVVELARGGANRSAQLPNTIDTAFGVASATKGFTAIAVASLVESGELSMATTLRSLLPTELPDVDERVTIEQLLEHTSGVGDYLDEELLGDVDDYVLAQPVHLLSTPAGYLPELTGRPQRDEPGSRFAYNNSGYVMLSLAIEAATGASFHDVVRERVFEPAAMTASGFFRSDDLPPGAALGYLRDGRTNVLHLPVRGAGDGGAYSTVGDIERFWDALLAGRLIDMAGVETCIEPRHAIPAIDRHYGLGFWLRPDHDLVMLDGGDPGVSFRSMRHRPTGLTATVCSNCSSGAGPLERLLDAELPTIVAGLRA